MSRTDKLPSILDEVGMRNLDSVNSFMTKFSKCKCNNENARGDYATEPMDDIQDVLSPHGRSLMKPVNSFV